MTTEDNLVTMSGKIQADGVDVAMARSTAANENAIGGNHHLPISARTVILVPSAKSNYAVKFQMRAVVESQRGRKNLIDPDTSTGDNLSYGRLWVEHYSSTPTAQLQYARASSSTAVAGAKSMCCTDGPGNMKKS